MKPFDYLAVESIAEACSVLADTRPGLVCWPEAQMC